TYYIQSSASGCTDIEPVTVIINTTPVLSITNPLAVCSPSTVDLTNASVTSGSTGAGTLTYWTDAGATTSLTSANAVSASGTYYIQSSASGCTDIEPVTVTINPSPVLSITNPPGVCSPATVDITAASVTSGSTGAGTLTYWTNAGATTSLTSPNAVSASGTYYIQSSASGCTDIEPVTVIINTTPVLSITNPLAVCSPSTVDLTTSSVTAGSTGGGTLSYWTNSSATTVLTSPGAVSASGTYYIQSSVSSCSDIQPVTVTINPSPVLSITNPPAVCSPATVDITAASVTSGSTGVGALTYWTDAGATTSLTSPNAVSVSGTYYIQSSASGCTDIEPVTVVINTTPVLSITNPPAVCSPATVDITATTVTSGSTGAGTLTYWTDAGATTSLTSPNAVSASGTYYIQSSASGCTDIEPVTVIINTTPVLSITNPLAVCSPSTIDLTNASVTAGSAGGGTLTYWTDAGATTSLTSPSAVSASGTYYIQSSSSGCTDIEPVTVVINTTPVLSITNPAAVCSPATVDITAASATSGSTGSGTLTYWTDAGATTSLTSPNAVSVSGTYYIQSSASGCTDIEPVIVTIQALPLPPSPTSNSPICSGGTLNLISGVTNGTVNWTNPSGAPIPGNDPQINNVYLFGHAGIYSATLTINGCTSSPATTNVVINPPSAAPVVQANNPQCAGTSLQLNAETITNATYSWTGPNGFTSSQQNPLINNLSAQNVGSYYLSVIVNGCESAASQTTATIDYADALFTATPLTGITPHNVNFLNQSFFANNYIWHFGTGISSTQKDTSYTYTEGGSYEVILIAYSSLANCPDTFSISILVESDSFLEIPNVFSPNGDGKNDMFKVKSRGLKSYSCSIYNRWGKLVFVSDDYNVGWDGKVSGKETADGAYFVMIKAEGLDGKPYEHTGTVTLIR
nr:gliding motility-associated C-terminal domain-containing protein [Bacteroidota bacterium]